jgi:hypothetical protein
LDDPTIVVRRGEFAIECDRAGVACHGLVELLELVESIASRPKAGTIAIALS